MKLHLIDCFHPFFFGMRSNTYRVFWHFNQKLQSTTNSQFQFHFPHFTNLCQFGSKYFQITWQMIIQMTILPYYHNFIKIVLTKRSFYASKFIIPPIPQFYWPTKSLLAKMFHSDSFICPCQKPGSGNTSDKLLVWLTRVWMKCFFQGWSQ